MSKPITRSKPARRLARTMPTMPPAGPDRMLSLPWKVRASVRPPLDCMNCRFTPGSSAGHLVDVAAQDRRQVGVDHGGVAARHQLHQRADPVRHRHLGEADLARDARHRRFVRV
jgi:hypothetical protein